MRMLLFMVAGGSAAGPGGRWQRGNYTELDRTNCWTGHGGVNIDTGPVASTFTVPSCEAHCDQTPGCHCVVMFANASAGNGVLSGCWRRSSCVPAKCVATGAFNTWLKPGSPPLPPPPPPRPPPPPPPPPPPNPLPSGGGACAAAVDCHLCGLCRGGRCVCDPEWAGSDCAHLNLQPARLHSGYPSVPATAALPSNASFTWGGAVVRSAGLYHGFFTEFLEHCPMTYGTWSTQTQIRHATSPAADGPWTPLDVAVPDAAGNPVLTQAPDGTWLLYFTSHRWRGPTRNCSGAVSAWGPPHYCKNGSDPNMQCAQGVSLAHSKTLAGPWTIQMDVVKFWATNPGAPIFRAGNGSAPASMLMAYKTATVIAGTMCRCIGALTAENWTAWPYNHFPLGAPNACIGADPHLEDPSNLWEDRRGNVHLLTHNNGWGGAAASPDFGRSWHFNFSRLSYDYEVEFEDGSKLACVKREEPKVLLGEDGQPTMLVTVCRLPDKLPNTAPCPSFPSGEPQYVTRVVMQPIGAKMSDA